MSKEEWQLLGYGLLTAILMALFLVPILAYKINLPKPIAEGVLGLIALVVFSLYKYVGHRKRKL
jgi:hypothetical protein